MFDPDVYRPKEEIRKWKEKDPIVYFKNVLIHENLLSVELEQKIQNEIEQEMTEAVKFAESGEEPLRDDWRTYLYAHDL